MNNKTVKLGKKITTGAMAGLILAGSLTGGMTQKASAEDLVSNAASAVDQCGGTNIAYAIDYTWSFSEAELQLQLDQASAFLDEYSKIPNATIDIYRFGQSVINPDSDPHTHKTFNVSTSEGLAAAKAYINEINPSNRGAIEADPNWSNAKVAGEQGRETTTWFSGTNWEAPLQAILDTGKKYDNILFSTDGSPNKYLDENGAWVETHNDLFDQTSLDNAVDVSSKILANGQTITPIFIKTSDNELGGAYTPERADATRGAIKTLTGQGDSAVLGEDYYSTAPKDLAQALYKSATAKCPTDLMIDKNLSGDVSNLKPGDTVEYTLTVKNDGSWAEPRAVVKDEGGAFIDPATVEIYEVSKGTAKGQDWTIGNLNPGETVTAKVRAKVSTTVTAGQTVINKAKVTGVRPDPTPDNNIDEHEFKTPVEDVKVSKKLSTAEVRPGSKLSWTLIAKNATDKPAYDVYVSDNSANATGLQANSMKFAGKPSKGELLTGAQLKAKGITDANIVDTATYWYLGTMAAGETATASVEGTVDLKAAAVSNTALISSRWDKADNDLSRVQKNNNSVDEDKDNKDKTDSTVKPFVSLLKIDKALVTAKDKLVPGGEISYKITVKNDGQDADPKVVVSEQPGEAIDTSTLKITPDNSKGTATGTTWNVGELRPGEIATATVTAKLKTGADATKGIENKAKVDGDYFNPKDQCAENGDVASDTDGCDIVSTKVNADVKVVKNSQGEYSYGEEGTWEIAVKNFGIDTATNTYVTELPLEGIDASTLKFEKPAKGEIISGKDLKAKLGTAVNPNVKLEDEKLYWFVGDLKSQEEAKALVKAIVTADGTDVVNATTVTTTWNPYDPNTPNQDNKTVEEDTDKWDKVTNKTEPYKTDLKVNKDLTTPKAELKPGGVIEYKITATNDSKFPDTNVVVTDTPDSNIVEGSMEITPEKGSIDAEGNWVIGDLAPGETVVATVKAKLADTVDVKDKGINNKATITGDHDEFDPNGQCEPNKGDVKSDTDNCDIEVTKINSDVKIAKTSLNKEVLAGEQGTWEITVLNEGEDPASGVYVAELPLEGIDASSLKFLEQSKGEIVKGAKLIEDGVAKEGEVEADKDYWYVGVLETGERATVKVSADITAKVGETVKNTTITSSTFDKYDPNGSNEENDTPEEDTDNFDGADITVVEEPTPPTTGEKTPVQNQGANTGADALAGAGILASLAGALGLGGFAAKRRARKN